MAAKPEVLQAQDGKWYVCAYTGSDDDLLGGSPYLYLHRNGTWYAYSRPDATMFDSKDDAEALLTAYPLDDDASLGGYADY